MSYTSPDIRNYYIGKGVVSFKADGESQFRDLGNVPVFEFTPNLEKLDHFSSREGVKSKDRSVVISKSGTIKMTMEEWTAENLAMALMGQSAVNSSGFDEFEIFAENAVSGVLKFTGGNEVGPKWTLTFNKVDFIPSSAINPISDEWGQLEVTGEAAAVDGSFGTAVKTADEP